MARSSEGRSGEPGDDGPEVVDLRAELSALHPRNWRDRLGGPDRYGVLLLLIVVTIVASVVLRDNEWERLVAVTMVAVMLLFALRTSQASKRLQRFALAFVLLTVIGTAAAAAVRDSDAAEIRVGMAALSTFLLLAVLFAIVHRLSTHLTISWPTILGALCIYLVFGMVFASAYSLAGHLQDGLLFVQQQGFTSADTLYFSLVALTTVGFGDLTMRADVTRIMSAMEALLGQIYLITAVGLLIGNLGRARRPRRRTEHD